MKMPWPWPRRVRKDRLVFACDDAGFAYVQAEGERIVRCGLELRGDDDAAGLARRVRALDLPSQGVTAVLPLADSQLLPIEAPAVPPEELKAAARWKIKGLVDAHIDDLTIDVMHVGHAGDGRQKAARQLFVVTTASQRVRALCDWSLEAKLQLAVIDIRETAQRNLQAARARARGRADRADATLMVHGNQCLLTLCAQEELFYARRLDWNPQWLQARISAPAVAPNDRPISDFADLDIVDYGATDDAGGALANDAPPIVIEIQRSLDVWERSWPELQFDQLAVYANGQTAALVAMLEPQLAIPVHAIDLAVLFPGYAEAAGSPAVENAVAPLLGALLRHEMRKL